MPVLSTLKSGVPVKLWASLEEVDTKALDQLKNLGSLPFVFRHVAAMPNVSPGRGAPVGTVTATQGAVCPAAVGIDIGCGVSAFRLEGVRPAQLEGKLEALLSAIESRVSALPGPAAAAGPEARAWGGWDEFDQLHERFRDQRARAAAQLGTLGGGGHFIEVCVDKDARVWALVHSGSRGIGAAVSEVYIEDARSLMERMRMPLPDPDLAYFAQGTASYNAYMHDLLWAQAYALLNREILKARVCDALCGALGSRPKLADEFDCRHNFASPEYHLGTEVLVARKGALRARVGDMGVVQGSMGTKTYIVRGKGNPESFDSCANGAGRLMPQAGAARAFDVEDLRRQTEGVVCRRDAALRDQAPEAFRDIDQAMRDQQDLVDIVAELRPVLCVKGLSQ